MLTSASASATTQHAVSTASGYAEQITTAGGVRLRLSSRHNHTPLRDRALWAMTAMSTGWCSAIHIAFSALSTTPASRNPDSTSTR